MPMILAHPWAVHPATVQSLSDLMQRGGDFEAAKRTAEGSSAAFRGPIARGTPSQLTVVNRTALIPIGGLLTYESFWPGDRASYTWIGARFGEAMDRDDVDRVVFSVDSAGGQVTGVSDLSQRIFNARGRKPMSGVVVGAAASAAYWLVSAAGPIVASRTSLLGSLGVVYSTLDFSKHDSDRGIERIEIVSSQSPAKATDPASSDGRARIQAMVDQLAAVFIDEVARNRGISAQRVLSDFGQGFVLVGQHAVSAGLADRIGSLSEVLEGTVSRGAGPKAPSSRASAVDYVLKHTGLL